MQINCSVPDFFCDEVTLSFRTSSTHRFYFLYLMGLHRVPSLKILSYSAFLLSGNVVLSFIPQGKVTTFERSTFMQNWFYSTCITQYKKHTQFNRITTNDLQLSFSHLYMMFTITRKILKLISIKQYLQKCEYIKIHVTKLAIGQPNS